jgi:hypothetical protein
MATAGDVWRVYIKPSLDGELVIRKKTTNQTSARLAARKSKLEALKGTGRTPAEVCHKELDAKKLCPTQKVYVTGVGYKELPVCPIKEMKSCLRKKMTALGKKEEEAYR